MICGQLECVQELCKHIRTSTISTPIGNLLHLCVNFHQNEILKYFCKEQREESKTLLEQKDSQGRTPFALSVTVDNQEALYILKALGANSETQDHQGRRPLHEAALRFNLFMIESLYYFGCKIEPSDNDRKRPIDLITGSDTDSRSAKALLTNLAQRTESFDNKPLQYNYLPPLNIVYKGGGPKGLAFVGALQVLERKGALKQLTRAGGTSAGAINAVLLALNYSYDEMLALLGNTNLTSFLDHPSAEKALMGVSLVSYFKENPSISRAFDVLKQLFVKRINPASIAINFFKSLKNDAGICEGETFRCWIDEQIEKKTGISLCTFKEYRNLIEQGKPFKHLHVFATQLGPPPKVFHFSSEDPSCDDIIISDPVTASMSIPLAYKPHIIHKKVNRKRAPCPELGSFVDGGLICNFPVGEFDRKKYLLQGLPKEEQDCPIFNKRTLGFSLYSPEEKELQDPQKIQSVGQLLNCIVALLGDAEEKLRQMNPYNQHRVIEIDNQGVGLLEFDLTPRRKTKLIESGKKATETFYDRQGGEVQEGSLFYLPRVLKDIGRALSLKSPHPHFIGRQALLQKLKETLFSSPFSQQSRVHVLYGPGGMGKSELAIAFAHRHLDDFSLVWSISCGSPEEMVLDYRTLATTLKLYIDEKDNLETIRQKVHHRLGQNTGKPWLLIFDNLNTSAPFPPRGGVVLITAYSKKADISATEVPFFSQEEGLELLETVTKKKSPLYPRLLELSGCYPLLLGQIANYLARTKIPVEEYIGILERNLNSVQPSDRYPKTLETALKLTVQQLPHLALKWLQICFYLNAAAIPVAYLDAWIASISPLDKDSIVLRRQDIITALQEHALLRYDPEAKIVSLHLDIQRTLHIFAEETFPKVFPEVVKLLVQMGQGWDLTTTKEWEKEKKMATLWVSHVEEILIMTELMADSDKIILLSKMGEWEYSQGQFTKSLEYHQKVLHIRKTTFGDHHPVVAGSFNASGIGYQSQGNFAKALEMHTQALNIQKATLSDRHPHVAASLNNIAMCYYSQGNFAKALEMYTQALDIKKATLGDRHLAVATSLNNIGSCYRSQGNFAKALEMYTQALDIQKTTLGDRHPDVAMSLNNIAMCYYSQGNFAKAQEMHTQALDIQKATLGDRHPDVATSLNNIGSCYRSQGNFAKALQTHTQALDIQKTTLGDRHLAVATSLNNIGICYHSLGNTKQAREYLQQAYFMSRELLGEGHPNTQTCKQNFYKS